MGLELVTVLLVKQLPVKSLLFSPFHSLGHRSFPACYTGASDILQCQLGRANIFPAKHYQRKKSSALYPLPMHQSLGASTTCPLSPWTGRGCRGDPGRAAAALRGMLSPFPSSSPQGKSAANGTRWSERLGRLELVFFFLWEVAEHILDNHFMLSGSGA